MVLCLARYDGFMEGADRGVIGREALPERLQVVKPVIPELWYRGNLDLLKRQKILAVVGSRRMTDYGRRVLTMLMPDLVGAGVVIVSGMMYGVDQEAHQLCLKLGGSTIAVLGFGLTWNGLALEDRRVYEKIVASGGLVISEWESRKPELWTFPARNRIVAGLADAVLVVEAAEKSGSLVTVSWAKKFGKPVLAIPGPITSKVSTGTNGLIVSGNARPITSAEDILCSLGVEKGQRQLTMFPGTGRMDGFTRRIVELLENEGLATDDIARRLREPVERVVAVLSQLSLTGVVEERGGRWQLSV